MSAHVQPYTYESGVEAYGRKDTIKATIVPTTTNPYADYGFQVSKPGGSEVGDVYYVSFEFRNVKGGSDPSGVTAYANGYKNPSSANVATVSNTTVEELSEGWKRWSAKVTLSAAGNTWWRFGQNSNSKEVEFYLDNFQIIHSDVDAPFVDGTRSTTDTIIDWAGGNTITANSLTYNSDGTFEFNGSSNKLSFPQPNIPVSVNDWTVEIWVRPTSSGHLIVPYSNGIDQQIRWATDKFVVVTCSSADTNGRSFNTGTASAPVNTWSLLTVTINYRTVNLYVNGVLKSTTVNDVDIAPWNGTWNVGQRGNNTNYFGGKIGYLSAYNRVLTATEVKQNYEAAKGRFQ
jgi:hypothetical protein